eukprot:1178866-Prorocentrum_minimum.AAC.3
MGRNARNLSPAGVPGTDERTFALTLQRPTRTLCVREVVDLCDASMWEGGFVVSLELRLPPTWRANWLKCAIGWTSR